MLRNDLAASTATQNPLQPRRNMAAFCGNVLPITYRTSRATISPSVRPSTQPQHRFRTSQRAVPTRPTPAVCQASSGQSGNPLKLLVAAAVAAMVSTASFAPMLLAEPAEAKPPLNSAPLRFQQSLLQDDGDAPVKLHAQWDVKSINSNTETFLMFSNDSSSVVDLWWIDYFGHEVYYASINPGTTHMQPSYATHPWVVRDHISQNSVLVLVAEAQPALAVVDSV